jgi:microtubule-associated protein 1
MKKITTDQKGRTSDMHKVLMTALVVLIGVAFAVTLFAQAPAEKAAPEKMMMEKKEMNPKMMSFSGEVTNMDMASKMMTVKGKKGDMTFDVSRAKTKGEMKAGDRVTVKYTEKDGKMMASSVMMAGGKKMKKKEMEKGM